MLWYLKLDENIIGKIGKELLNDMDEENDKLKIRKLFYEDYTNMNIKLIDKFNLDLTLFFCYLLNLF